MEELERLLPVHVVELADVLDGVGLVVEAHGGADLAGVGLGARVDEEVLLQRVVVPERLEADGALGAPVEARPHVEAARAGLDQAAGRYELDLKMMGGRNGETATWQQHLVTHDIWSPRRTATRTTKSETPRATTAALERRGQQDRVLGRERERERQRRNQIKFVRQLARV